MKTILKNASAAVSVLLMLLLLHSCSNYPEVIDKPEHGLKNTTILKIDKVSLTDTATVLYFDATFHPNYWIRIAGDTYLKAAGEKYLITGADGIKIDTEHWMPASGRDSFALFFPPIPKGIKTVDFLEGDCDDCFKIWDIDLTGKGLRFTPDFPREVAESKIDKNAILPPVELKPGKTTVNVHFCGLKDGYAINEPMLIVGDVASLTQKQLEPVSSGGNSYTFEFLQSGTTTAMIVANYRVLLQQLVLAPGETTDVYFDNTMQSVNEQRQEKGLAKMRYVGFTGKFASLNTELSLIDRGAYEQEGDERGDFSMLDMTPVEWVKSEMKKAAEVVAKIEKDPALSPAAKTYLSQNKKVSCLQHINRMESAYEWKYREKNNLDFRTPIDYKAPKFTDEVILLTKEFQPSNIEYLYQNGAIYGYSDFIMKLSSDAKLSELTGGETGIIQDIKKAGRILHGVENLKKLTVEEEAILNSLSLTFLKDAFWAAREEAQRKYNEALAKGGYTILDTPKAAANSLLETIIAQHKGKPLFIDFWATWCGPCIQGMKAIKPFKPEMKEKGVEVLYISGETSPKSKWMGMLPDIGGLHYYLTNDEWGAVCGKYKVDGIPCYMIVDKKGKIVYQQSGFPGVDKLREEFSKVW